MRSARRSPGLISILSVGCAEQSSLCCCWGQPSSREAAGRPLGRQATGSASPAHRIRNFFLTQARRSLYVPRMPSRRSQPQGAPTDLSEATRLKFAELLMELAALCTCLLAGVTEALLQSENLTGAQRAALRVAMAGLGPIARQVEAQAAKFRDGLPEQDNQPPPPPPAPRPWAPQPWAARPAARRPARRHRPRPSASAADPSAKSAWTACPFARPFSYDLAT